MTDEIQKLISGLEVTLAYLIEQGNKTPEFSQDIKDMIIKYAKDKS